jgi:hypothetical protein
VLTVEQYFFNPTLKRMKVHTVVQAAFADSLLEKVNALLDYAREQGVYGEWVDPDTDCQISGAKGGSGDGGFRAPDTGTGAPHSNHRLAHAVDVYDPHNALDSWLNDEILERFGLYREHFSATPGWCHLQDVPPGSGKRTYLP